jgi:hypothetical protein
MHLTRAHAFVCLLPFLSVACASQHASLPDPSTRALESVGGEKEFPCGDKPIQLDVLIGYNLQLFLKSPENSELSATWKADKKHTVTQAPGIAQPYDISEFEAGDQKGTWKQPGQTYHYQWDNLGGAQSEMRLTINLIPPPASTCRFYSSHINPAK